MSDNPSLDFAKFVPGFDFLQNLAKGASGTMPKMANWVAPTMNVEELDKRIDELKAVHFWLDQNTKALNATIQALELQKMTLATLKGMNFQLGDVANALKLNTAEGMFAGMQKMGEQAVGVATGFANAATGGATQRAAAKAAAKTETKTDSQGDVKAGAKAGGKAADEKGTAHEFTSDSGSASAGKSAPAGVVDPMQWWGALTQQFQQIATSAMQDAAKKTAVGAARNMATGMARETFKAAAGVAKAATAGARKRAAAPPPPAAARKPARKR